MHGAHFPAAFVRVSTHSFFSFPIRQDEGAGGHAEGAAGFAFRERLQGSCGLRCSAAALAKETIELLQFWVTGVSFE